MAVSETVHQYPQPGRRHIAFRGDVLRFHLTVDASTAGSAWLRTNIGGAAIARREIIEHVEANRAPLHQDWFDIPMAAVAPGRFEVTLPFCDVGHFEAKAYFLPDSDGHPVWPPGDNTAINVESAESVCGNIIYNAFIRQFGPNKHSRQEPAADMDFEKFDERGYTVIPPSGTIRGFIRELDFIVHELGCRYIQLLPINPTPTTYGRMGRFGSPYAAQSFKLVDTALAEFDPRATPLEQFMELVDAVHRRHAKIILDIAINHTGWGARLHETRPHWVKRADDGTIEVPGAWGVTWEDLTKLDYRHTDLWQFMAGVFLTWCKRGVDGFRCDAGYMIPTAAWRYIIACVREQYPDTIFFLEGLGGKISVTRDLLNTANMNWAYSELFQNYDRGQIESYLPDADAISVSDGVMIHFAETHDNNRLAATSKTYARMRTALCALLSRNGGFAFANGVEWFATEKIDVHDAPPLNWGAKINQVDHIRRLTTLLKVHPCFWDQAALEMIEAGSGNFIAVLRRRPEDGKQLVIVVNLDAENGVYAQWQAELPAIDDRYFIDLITDAAVEIEHTALGYGAGLQPGQVLCLTADSGDRELIDSAADRPLEVPERIGRQRLRAKTLDVFQVVYGVGHLGDFDVDAQAQHLRADPEGFCRRHNQNNDMSRVIRWQWPADVKREVMVPPGHFLLVTAPIYFEARLMRNDRVAAIERAIESEEGQYFALFSPMAAGAAHRRFSLKLSVYAEAGCRHREAPLLYLAEPDAAAVAKTVYRDALTDRAFLLLATNGAGAVARASSWWGQLNSRYDALLAANMDRRMPVNRWVMLTRCRAWLVYQDYSQAVRTDCIERLAQDEQGRMFWQYRVPTGLGRHILFSVALEMVPGQNRIRMHFFRHSAATGEELSDDRPVRLIVRPDIENRSFHDTTKAYTGPENDFPAAVRAGETGFAFVPDPGHRLDLDMEAARFVWEPEWTYMVYRPLEAERGLDPNSDLFSPGYLQARLSGGQSVVLDARVGTAESPLEKTPVPSAISFDWPQMPEYTDVGTAMNEAMDRFVVDRQHLKSVIAGYPWFLDWGRDSLIFCRGLIAAGRCEEAVEVIKLFGRFEEQGTLPNMICGDDAGNRDTSDAPLWFMVACRDLAAADSSMAFLDESCGARTIREILFSIAAGYAAGTPNGVKMDAETGLIFSPAHFTWMDTNFPAGSPRQGYPVEIQALWYAGLSFLAQIRPPEKRSDRWPDVDAIRRRVAEAVETHFYDKSRGYLSDCLHGAPGCRPGDAVADDALRPNQVFAITMGAVSDPEICRPMLSAASELVVPGAIRSLADRPVTHAIEIRHNGERLGDPYHPYRGRYRGDEDHCRKPAYHNGTAWTWVFPSFCEAWAMTYGDAGRQTAMAWLASSTRLINENGLAQMPEIADGDYPHCQRGCDAQAWGASELYRVWRYLDH